MPSSLANIDAIEYSVALIQPRDRTLLCPLVGADKTRALPRFRIPINVRITVHLRNAIYAAWGLRGVVLDYLPSEICGSPCAVMELFLFQDVPAALRPVDLQDVRDNGLSPWQRNSLLSLLSEIAEGPVSRIGWLYEAIEWVEEVSGQKISSIQEIEQLNAGQHFSLLRFPMQNGHSHWLKATGKPNKHELPLTSFLSQLCPDHIPEVLDVRAEWNAWITGSQRTYSPFPVDDDQRLEALRSAVVAMAKIQLQSIEHHTELLARGAIDHRTNVLRSNALALFECIPEAMSQQISTNAAVIDDARLREMHRTLDDVCDFLEMLPIPPMVLHGDMNTGNVLYDDGHCQFVDWCETYVGHPFITLQHILLLNRPADVRLKPFWDAELVRSYQAIMTEGVDPDVFDRAITSTPLLAVASALYGRGDWLNSLSSLPPQRQARIRTLARYMDRAASELCESGRSLRNRIALGGLSCGYSF